LNQGVLDKIVGLKYFNVFGPNEAHKGKMASMVYHMYNQIMTDGHVKLFASNDPNHYRDGEQVRDFIYVKDVARMTTGFLENDLNGIYNMGTGHPHTWNELAAAVFKAMGRKTKIEYVPMPESLSKNYQNYTAADMKKYEHALKSAELAPFHTTPLEDAVEDYVKHHLMQGQRW
jgi:ADP-L-glycero-D-manno-heptose 6-epimerase